MSTKLFVGNLDFHTTRTDLEAFFGEVGPLRDVFLPLDRATSRPRGFAFVEYDTESDALIAIEKFNGQELGGRAIRVNAAEERAPQTGGFTRSAPPPSGGRSGAKPKGSRRNLRSKKRSL
jgi:RNA recognition motif-containing protein